MKNRSDYYLGVIATGNPIASNEPRSNSITSRNYVVVPCLFKRNIAADNCPSRRGASRLILRMIYIYIYIYICAMASNFCTFLGATRRKVSTKFFDEVWEPIRWNDSLFSRRSRETRLIGWDRWQNSRKIFGPIDARISLRNGDADADADADVENSATALSITRRVGIGANKARENSSRASRIMPIEKAIEHAPAIISNRRWLSSLPNRGTVSLFRKNEHVREFSTKIFWRERDLRRKIVKQLRVQPSWSTIK